MEIWIAPILTGLLVGIVIMFGNRILTRLDQIDARLDRIDARLTVVEKDIAVLQNQMQMVLDYFMPEKKNRVGE